MERLILFFSLICFAGCVLQAQDTTAEQKANDYRTAAERGDVESQYLTGNCYYNGYGVERDSIQALYWWLKSAEQGYAQAQYAVGYCYHIESGVERDIEQVLLWFHKAAEQGYAEAQYALGSVYENSSWLGLETDYKKATYWYRIAAEQGHAMAQYSLGSHYEHGKGVEKDCNTALYWYEKALTTIEEGSHKTFLELFCISSLKDKGYSAEKAKCVR
jgi:TPR repeat protein